MGNSTALFHDDESLLANRTRVTDDLSLLLELLPERVHAALTEKPDLGDLLEVVLDLGRLPEARFSQGAEYLGDEVITAEDLDYAVGKVGEFSGDNRAGIERTLHRISAIRNRHNKIIGLTCRVGRAIYGTIAMIRDLVEAGQSILMLGRPGVGKTTALREIARVLADDLSKRVVIIDTSNEIAGDGDIPHPAIGRARRMQVARPELQHQVMIEAVENHMPEVIVIDEIGTELEAIAARTIAERGVMLVGTAHGNQLVNLIKNPTLSDLIGGIQSVTLGDEEARRRGSQKSVLERKAPPTFQVAIEMQERYRWVVHEDVAAGVDLILRDRQPTPQVRTVSDSGKVIITREFPDSDWKPTVLSPRRQLSIPPVPSMNARFRKEDKGFMKEDNSFMEQVMAEPMSAADFTLTGDGTTLNIYPYGVSRNDLEQIIRHYSFPVHLTKDIDDADVVLALRTHLRDKAKICAVAQNRQIPIHTVKTNSVPYITRALRRLLQIDEPAGGENLDLNMLLNGDSEDELEALEEARLAVEQIVIPKGQTVELLPRSPNIRRMQHELIEHYQLRSKSFGDEPNRRLRIYPERA
ncbi:R3H domain-containing nucleic acid-binding protein [Anthocerotibacter panamensis]|uniref:R3H domain-containing nucleic acid-binding protein n=1 Tax=Anthocerotibacter panamensis TaxID=2857077 RepID=UPI001C40396D|nr:R3H domain-containing nucleic acid-binding protein [Anthocerotibacter panamensis]